MKVSIRTVSKYICLFVLFFISFLFLPHIAADETWSYGFSYNMASGLVPYRDFNMIVPPFFSFLFSIGLVFYKGIIMFHAEGALLLCFICYLLEKLTKEKSLILILCLLITTPMIYNLPTYNILIFAFTLLLIFLQQNNKSDWVIGLILGLSFLTKQSIGLFLILVSFYCVKDDISRLIKRFFGMMIPFALCLLYLIITNSLFPFLDQCFLGMFDFSKNGQREMGMPIVVLTVFIIFIKYFRKYHFSKEWLYTLAFYSVCFPLFDLSHFLIGFFALMVTFFAHRSFSTTNYQKIAFILLIVIIPIINSTRLLWNGHYPNDIPNYQYRYLNSNEYKNLHSLRLYHQQHSDYNIVILSTAAYIFKLTNNLPITKLDLINTGNWGYHGTDKIIKEINSLDKNTLFLINPAEFSFDNQIDKKVLQYVIDHGSVVDTVLFYDVYQLNSSKNFQN